MNFQNSLGCLHQSVGVFELVLNDESVNLDNIVVLTESNYADGEIPYLPKLILTLQLL